MTKNKVKKWSKFRNRFFVSMIKVVLYPFLKIKYHFNCEKVKDKRSYLVLFNHVTFLDQFMVIYAVNSKLHFVISDDFDSVPIFSPLMRFMFHSIPFKKSASDIVAVKNMIKVAKENRSIIISPEGNRTYVGKTEYIKPSIVKLIKTLKLPVLCLNVHGFYAYPRFAVKGRSVKIDVKIKNILEYDEYKDLDDDVLYSIVKDNLWVNGYDNPLRVKYKKRAEKLERVIYRCPKCGITHFVSKNDTIKCMSCGDIYHLDEYYNFTDGEFKNIQDWNQYQIDELMKSNLSSYDDNNVITSDIVRFSEVIPHKRKELIYKECEVKMYKNRLVFTSNKGETVVMFDDITSSGCFGNNKFNLIGIEKTYQIKGDKGLNALKYVNHIYKYKIEKGEIKDGFLGI